MGLIVNIYRNGKSFTNWFANVNKICVVNISGSFDPDEKIGLPAAFLTVNALGNPIIIPARKDFGEDWKAQPGQWMNGGDIAATSDSRFGEAVRKLSEGFYGGLYIHDRQE